MNNLRQLYLGFDGRIGRKTFWLGILGLIGAAIVLTFIIMPLFTSSPFDMSSLISTNNGADPGAFGQSIMDAQRRMGWANLLIFAILLVPLSALFIKRRHDRGSAGKAYWVYVILVLAMSLLQATGIGYSALEVSGLAVPLPGMLTNLVTMAAMVLLAYLLVVAGFLKGDAEDNLYGPAPSLNNNQ